MADRENRSPPAPPAPPADPAELSDELELAFELAALGTSIAVPRFEHGDFTVTRKPDGSPVTNADQAVERAQRELLAARRPDHAIIGEEFGPGGRSDWCWYLDPIDGTSRFIKHDPGWMTLVALAHRGRVLVGVVAMPALGERWWAARGAGAFHDGARLSVSSTSCLADAVVSDDWHRTLARDRRDHPLAVIAARAGSVSDHVGHSALAVASGRADVALGRGGFPWDYAPLAVIVEEAGGRFSDFDGAPRFDARQSLSTNGRLHDEVLAVLHEPGGPVTGAAA